jgi:hypothetical protein
MQYNKSMKKVKIIASDHNPVQVGDGVVVS